MQRWTKKQATERKKLIRSAAHVMWASVPAGAVPDKRDAHAALRDLTQFGPWAEIGDIAEDRGTWGRLVSDTLRASRAF